MRVISRTQLREFWLKHRDSEGPLRSWYKAAIAADWDSLQAVRNAYPHADAATLDSGALVTIFNIGGNKYRLIVRIIYPYRRIYIGCALTHAEYDKGAWKKKLWQK
jgi:mRNA interferase HigB